MDPSRIVQALKGTLSMEERNEAEKLLLEMHKIINFTPTLLQIVVEESLEIPIRQAGVVYLKNIISSSWQNNKTKSSELWMPFSIHEQDRITIRNNILTAIVVSPEPIQVHLTVALEKIIGSDFPSKMSDFPEKIRQYLTDDDQYKFKGALLALCALVKVYEFQKKNRRHDVNQLMSVLLPILYHRLVNLMSDYSDASLTLQKLILKIFYHHVNVFLPLDILGKETIGKWIDVFASCLGDFSKNDTDSGSLWWKRKKWAITILCRIFERYGSPEIVTEKYTSFSEWYLKSFSQPLIHTLLKVCEAYRQKTFISPKVLGKTLSYLNSALSYSFSWRVLRPHFPVLAQDVIFPVMCHSEEDDELWSQDPIEYIHTKASDLSMNDDPSYAASTLLLNACLKRKGVLDSVMQFCIHVLSSQERDGRSKDGAMHMIGAVSEILLKNKMYRNQMENFLVNHVLPTFQAPEGYRRGRACWILGKLVSVEFRDVSVLHQSAQALKNAMWSDPELPVRSLAALGLFKLLEAKENVRDILPPFPELMMQLLQLLRETEFDDFNDAFTLIVSTYKDDILPVAPEMIEHMSATFLRLLRIADDVPSADGEQLGSSLINHSDVSSIAKNSGAGDMDSIIVSNGISGEVGKDEDVYADVAENQRSITAIGIITNIITLLMELESHIDVMAQIEPVVVNLIRAILKHDQRDVFEEALSLVRSLTSHSISPLMWHVFDWIYQAFEKDSEDYFTDMIPSLHNYICVDREAFLSDTKRIEAIFSMCSKVLNDDGPASEAESRAVKLLEVVLINHPGKINNYAPKFIELALSRITCRELTPDLKSMCLQIVVAGIYYSPDVVLSILCSHNWPGTDRPILNEFMTQWISEIDSFTGIHSRRLCVLVLCMLLSLPQTQRPEAVTALSKDYMPSLLILLNGLKIDYTNKAKEKAEEDTSSEDESDDDAESKILASDEDYIDEEVAVYLQFLEQEDEEADYFGDSVGSEIYDCNDLQTDIDSEETEMDEFITFYHVMIQLEQNDAAWYQQLVSGLTPEQQNDLKQIVETAVKCMHQKDSKRIEQAGGYNFLQTTVPKTFNFGPSQSPGQWNL